MADELRMDIANGIKHTGKYVDYNFNFNYS